MTQHSQAFEDSEADDELGGAKGLIIATPLNLLVWGFVIGALVWVL